MKFLTLDALNNFLAKEYIFLFLLFLFPTIITILNKLCYYFKILDLPSDYFEFELR